MADQPPINPNDPNARLIDQLNRLNEHLARMNERAEETLAATQQSQATGAESAGVGGTNAREVDFNRLVDKIIERIDAQRPDPSSRPGQPNSAAGSHPPDSDEPPDHAHRSRQISSDAGFIERTRYAMGGDANDSRSRLAKWADPRQPQGAASTPPVGDSTDPRASNLLPGFNDQALKSVNKPIELLAYGEYQLDTKLAIARDTLARAALKGSDPETGEQPSAWRRTAGEAAGAVNYLHDRAPYIQGGLKAYEKISTSLEHTRDIGENMGYDPWGGSVGVGGLGIANPLSMLPGAAGSAAARQGWQVRLNDARMRFMPGIGEETGKEISSSLMGQGWSGSDLNALTFRYAVPLAQHGIDPSVSAEFTQALKSGNTSLPDLTKSLMTLGESARTARMPLDLYAKSVSAFADQMENMGLTRGQSINAAQQFTGATGGLDPQMGAQWAQNPLFQGFAMQHGFMPSQIGLMGGGGIAQTQLQVLRTMMGSAGGFGHDKYETIGGKRVLQASGQDMQLAQAASQAGIPLDVAKRLWRNQDQIGRAAKATDAISGAKGSYENELQAAEAQAKRTGGKVDYSKIGKGAGGVDWNMATTAARAAHVTDAEIKTIMKDDKSQWGKELQHRVDDHTKQKIDDGSPKVKVDFTDRAAKWLKQANDDSASAIGSAAKAVGIPAVISGHAKPPSFLTDLFALDV